jgi:hypothetical protein
MKNKYYALIDEKGDIVSLDDTRKDDSQMITISTTAIYPTKIDANRMKDLIDKVMKKKDTVTIKEVTIK